MWFLWLLLFIFGISFLITIHELGHYLFAKFAKMEIAEFSIGFGPAIYQRVGKETTFSIRAIPLGGYVAVLSDRIKISIENIQNSGIEDHQQWDLLKQQAKPFNIERDYSESKTYEQAPFWKKSLFILAGVSFNYIIGFIFLLFVYGINGKPYNSDTIMVTSSTSSSTTDTINNAQNFVYNTRWGDPKDSDNPNDPKYIEELETISMSEKFLFKNVHGKWEQITNNKNKEMKNYKIDGIYWNYSVTNDNKKDMPRNGEEVNKDFTTSPYYMGSSMKNIFNESSYTQKQKININSIAKYDTGTLKFEWTNASYVVLNMKDNNDNETIISIPSLLPLTDEEASNRGISKLSFDDSNKSLIGSSFSTLQVLFNTSSSIVKYEKLNAGEVIGFALRDVFVFSIEMFILLGQNFTKDKIISDNIPPYNQVDESGNDYIHTAPGMFMWGTYLTSNLMLFNIFPWPPLDGYRFIEAAYEDKTKKKINPKLEKGLKNTGTIFTILFVFLLII